MALEQSAPLASYDDYAALDDGKRYQVVDGVLVLMPSPSFQHQEILGRLFMALSIFVRANPIGKVCIAPLDVVLRAERPAVVLQPDLLFISHERKAVITAPNVQGAPDLVVEILSPGTARLDLTRKKQLYAEYGVLEYWVVWPDVDRVEVYRSRESGSFGQPQILELSDVLDSPLLPGFSLPLAELFSQQP
jgi:Uma2 family endonuclease